MPESKSLIRRIFGDPVSGATEKAIPGIRGAWMGRQIERPDLEGQVTSISPMSMFNKWRYPDAYASTSPFGSIQINQDLINKDKQDINDVLVHEMTHANQGVGGFLRKFYNPSADENAAINAEAMRNVRRGDIELRGTTDPNINVPVTSAPIISKATQPVPPRPNMTLGSDGAYRYNKPSREEQLKVFDEINKRRLPG